MATASAQQWMSADELMELPDDGHVYELSRGTLVCMSPSSYVPSRLSGRVVVKIGAYVDEHDLGDYGSSEGGFRLATNPDTVRAPDAWYVRKDRVPLEEDFDGYYQGPPDLAVEVLSPSDRFNKVMAKVRDYLDAGTPLVWVLDPKSRLTAVFRPGQPIQFIDENGALDGEDVLPGFSLPLRDLFR